MRLVERGHGAASPAVQHDGQYEYVLLNVLQLYRFVLDTNIAKIYSGLLNITCLFCIKYTIIKQMNTSPGYNARLQFVKYMLHCFNVNSLSLATE